MNIDTAKQLMKKVEFRPSSSNCWIPKYKTHSVRYGKEMFSLTYLAYVISGETEPFRYRQEVLRTCHNNSCYSPEHLLFREMDRFWSYSTIDDRTGCWIWNHSKDGGGYGVFLSSKYGREKAHRIAYMETYGRIPSGKFVCHICDNPSCIFPEHLFLGTNQDNMNDKVSKNRQSRLFGETNGRTILTKNDVINLRNDYMSGKFSYRQLVSKYNISQTQVARIIKKESWSWV